MSFNPDHDDLQEWFFVSFMEEWRMHSSEKDKEALERLNVVCAKTDKLIDWLLENMDSACDCKIAKPFAQAILNTLDLDGLMARMDEWRENHTCISCKLFDTDCDCDKCPHCDEITGNKNYTEGKSCCRCEQITFCGDCVSKQEEQSYCSHEWEGHYVCRKCEDH